MLDNSTLFRGGVGILSSVIYTSIPSLLLLLASGNSHVLLKFPATLAVSLSQVSALVTGEQYLHLKDSSLEQAIYK